jgi:putative FmdB family regulatory protein
MPVYEFRCQAKCGLIEVTKRMADPSPTTCPHCGASLERIYSAYLHGACDAAQELENDGLGKWNPQLGPRYLDAKTKTKRNPDAYARSRADAADKFKRKGYESVEKY